MADRTVIRRLSALAVIVAVLGLAPPVSAQAGRVAGVVRDENGRPIKSATVVAENTQATPSTLTAVTDDRGRWAMIGLQTGLWRFKASAPGYLTSVGTSRIQALGTNPPLEFRLARGHSTAAKLAGVNPETLQADLDAADEQLANGQLDEAIASYEAILARAPALTMVNLTLGRAWRLKKQYDEALAAYQRILDVDASHEKAQLEIGMTHLERGDLEAADAALTAAAEHTGASREVLYHLGEVKFARGSADEAAAWYQKSIDVDPGWVQPYFKLALLAMHRDDVDAAVSLLQKVVDIDPDSSVAAQAKTLLDEIRRD